MRALQLIAVMTGLLIGSALWCPEASAESLRNRMRNLSKTTMKMPTPPKVSRRSGTIDRTTELWQAQRNRTPRRRSGVMGRLREILGQGANNRTPGRRRGAIGRATELGPGVRNRTPGRPGAIGGGIGRTREILNQR